MNILHYPVLSCSLPPHPSLITLDSYCPPFRPLIFYSIPVASLPRRSVQAEVYVCQDKEYVDPAAASDGRQTTGSPALRSSPSADFDTPLTTTGTYESGSPQTGPGQGSQSSLAGAEAQAATDTVSSSTSPISQVPLAVAHAQQVLHETGTTVVCGAGAAEMELHRLPHSMATNAQMPETLNPAAATTDLRDDVGWQSVAIEPRSAMGADILEGDPTSNSFEGETWPEPGEMKMTDDDLYDVAAVLLEEEGLL